MPLNPTWQDIALRLALTIAAAAAIGFDRSLRGHAAGLRTTMLVGIAASVAMIQANLLLTVGGKAADSFSVMDVMRLPLGILTGVGFIGGGTILRRGDLITGVTTAATLWAITVIGLAFGGDQLGLGIAATVLGLFTLRALKWFDLNIPREQHAMLVVETEDVKGLVDLIAPLGYGAQFRRRSRSNDAEHFCFEIFWHRAERAGPPLDLLDAVDRRYKVVSFKMIGEPAR